jgi:hypothetical protein
MSERPITPTEQAADAIVALINSRVQSPSKVEIVAILDESFGKSAGASSLRGGEPAGVIAAHREEWSRLFADWYAKVDIAGDMRPDAPGEKDATAAADAALDVLQDLETDLCELRATRWEDIAMLADILLRNEFDPPRNGLWDESCEAYLDGGPTLEGEWIDHITARLLRAIRDVMLAQASFGPWRRLDQHRMIRDLAPPERDLDLHLRQWDAAVRQCLNAKPQDDERAKVVDDEICTQTERVWARPVRSWDDVILRVAVAVHWNEPGYPDAKLTNRHYDCRALAYVVRAVLDLAGLRLDSEGRLLGRKQRDAAVQTAEVQHG